MLAAAERTIACLATPGRIWRPADLRARSTGWHAGAAGRAVVDP